MFYSDVIDMLCLYIQQSLFDLLQNSINELLLSKGIPPPTRCTAWWSNWWAGQTFAGIAGVWTKSDRPMRVEIWLTLIDCEAEEQTGPPAKRPSARWCRTAGLVVGTWRLSQPISRVGWAWCQWAELCGDGDRAIHLHNSSRPQQVSNSMRLVAWKPPPVPQRRTCCETKRYLSAPPTSVASERLFSLASRVFTDRRNRLAVKKADMLLFIKHNLPLISFKYWVLRTWLSDIIQS